MYSDEDILEGCKRKERFFQELLYKRFSNKMYGICLRYAHDQAVAHDIFQEGFIKVYQNLHTFKGDSALGSWMYRIFMTTSINYIQRTLKNKFEVSINESVQPIDDSISEEEAEHWMNHLTQEEALIMVQELPEKYRLIINMYAVDQMSHTEIARVLNITESSSRSQLSRARKMLNDKLKLKMDKKIGGQ